MIDAERAVRLAALQEALGYTFDKLEVLDHALTHTSYANEVGRHDHYERLEFLGDAVLDAIVSTYLYAMYRPRALRVGEESTLIRQFDQQEGSILSVAFRPDGQRVARPGDRLVCRLGPQQRGQPGLHVRHTSQGLLCGEVFSWPGTHTIS